LNHTDFIKIDDLYQTIRFLTPFIGYLFLFFIIFLLIINNYMDIDAFNIT